jgi:hypothetical protein
MVGVYQKKNKGDIVYYAKRLNYSFSLPKLGADGKPVQKTNPNTGLPIFDLRGNPEFIEEPVSFIQWKTRFSEEGYCCVFIVTKDTPQRIKDELKKDAADRTCAIMDEKAYIKSTNPDLAEKISFDEANEAAIAEKDSKLAEKDKEIADLRAKLSGGGQRRQ